MSDPGFWREIVDNLSSAIAEWLPTLLMAGVVLIVGWLIAAVCQAVVRGALRRIGVDSLAEKSGLSDTLAEMRLDRSASVLLGRIVYWLVLLFFVLVALEGLGLTAVAETLQILVAYLPNVLAALLIVIIGGFLARIAGDATAAASAQYGIAGGKLLGQLARWGILIFAAVLAMEQLKLDTFLIVAVMIVVLGAAALALALALGFGTRDLAGQLVAGMHASDAFEVGQNLRVGEHTGRLVSIGAATALLETEDGLVSIPNHKLLASEVIIYKDDPTADDTVRQG